MLFVGSLELLQPNYPCVSMVKLVFFSTKPWSDSMAMPNMPKYECLEICNSFSVSDKTSFDVKLENHNRE